MAKTTINIKADADVKKKAQRVAKSLGMPLSTIINAYLHQLVRTKAVSFGVPEGTLKPAVKRRLDRLAKEVREGKNLAGPFDTVEDAISYLRS